MTKLQEERRMKSILDITTNGCYKRIKIQLVFGMKRRQGKWANTSGIYRKKNSNVWEAKK